jgi:hypothetical protein
MKSFTRNLLKEMHQTVRAFMPAIAHPMKVASVTGPSCGHFFVEIQGDGIAPMNEWFSAADKYEARAAAWDRYLTKHSSGYAEGAAEQEVA